MIKKIMIMLICALILPIVVNADMGAPEITSYDVLVTNTNGAQAYDYDGNKLDKVFDFNDSLTIIMEISIDGKIYLGVDYEEEDQDNNSYYINEKDVSIDGEVNFDKLEKRKGKLYVFDEGAELYKGPSKKYGVIENSNIPIGTTLTYEYSDDLWAYVEYNGKKGWIYTYSFEGFSQYEDLESSVCSIAESNHVILKDEIEIYEKPDLDSNKQKVSIPRNTIVTGDKTFVRYPKSSFEYIKFGEYEGWIYVEEDSDTFGYKAYNYENEITKVLTVDSINLTEFIENGETMLVIPKGEKITLETYYVYEKDSYDGSDADRYYYIEYNGNKGWIRSDKLAIYENSALLTLKEINLLKDFNSQDIQSTLRQYDEIKGYYRHENYSSDDSYYYIEKDNAKGWVNNKEDVFASSSSCSQYFILEKKGQEITSLTGEKINVPYQAILTELFYYYKDDTKYSIVEYKDKRYILATNSYVAETPYYSKYIFKDEDNENLSLMVYKDEMLEEFSFEISNGEKFDVLFKYGEWGYEKYFINYNGKKGWISGNNDKLEAINIEKEFCLINENLEIEYEEENSSSTSNINKTVNSKTIVITCVIVATAISLTAVVTIILINKNKKNKNDKAVNNIQK